MAITQLSKETSRNELGYSSDHLCEKPKEQASASVKDGEQRDVSEIAKPIPKKPASLAKLSGVDLRAIDQGIIRMRVPLLGGKIDLPGPFADASIKVKNNSVGHFDLGIGKKNGETVVTGASIKFLPAIKIKNPASAFKPTKTSLATRLFDVDYIKDKVADIVLSGIQIAKDGQIHLDGYVKIGLFGKKDLSQLIPSGTLPKFDLNLEALKKLEGSSKLDVDRVLKSLGGVLGEATFTVEAHTEPRKMDFEALGIHAWTDTSCAQINLQGRATLTRQNSFHVNLDANESEIRLQNGKINLGGEVRIANLARKPDIQSHIAFAIDPHPIHASFKVSDLTTFNLDLPKGGNRLQGHAFVFRDSLGSVSLKDASSLSAQVAGIVNGDLKVHTDHLDAKLKNGRFAGKLDANLSADSGGVSISSGTLQATIGASDLSSNLHGINFLVPGEFNANIHASTFQYTSASKTPNAQGLGELTLQPNLGPGKEAVSSMMRTRFGFDLKSDASLRLNLIEKGFTDFLKPYFDLVLQASKKEIAPGIDSAPIGSSQFRKRCEILGNAKIRSHNKIELLIDGVSSLPKRLELIKNAQKSICMQTMVFKDDESGGQITDALCEAVSRGVDVRVIVDALGNSTSLMDVIGMNPVYQRLQSGGVNLQIHNNSIGLGVRKILNALSQSPNISEFFNFEDLMNPEKVFSTINLVINAAVGTSDLRIEEKDKRELVEGLSLILTGGKTTYSPETVKRFAKITKDNIIELGEVLELLKQNAHLNFRWHEKYLIADENTAIVGGLNTADEYLLGGTQKQVKVRTREGETWRDTDVFLKGESARDAFSHFADNWSHLTNETIESTNPLEANSGDFKVQMVHSRPRIDGDSNITDLLVECLGSLRAGESAYIENAYFLPTGGAAPFEDALIDAAKRGVDVRVLVNSHDSIDVKPVAEGAVFSERRLLENGVRVFERTGNRMMHSKVATFGGKVSIVGSWNADNRSSSLNSESAAFVHSQRFSRKIERMIQEDMKEGVARERLLEEIEHLPMKTELRNALSANFSDFL